MSSNFPNKFSKPKGTSYSMRYINMYLTKEMGDLNSDKSTSRKIKNEICNLSQITPRETEKDNDFVGEDDQKEDEDFLEIFQKGKGKIKLQNPKKIQKEIQKQNELIEAYEIVDDNYEKNFDKILKNIPLRKKEPENETIKTIKVIYHYGNYNWGLIEEKSNEPKKINDEVNYFWMILDDNFAENTDITNLNKIEENNQCLKKQNEKLRGDNFSLLKKYEKSQSVTTQYEVILDKQKQIIEQYESLISKLKEENSNLINKIKNSNTKEELMKLITQLQSENDILKNKNKILNEEFKKIPTIIRNEMKVFKSKMDSNISNKMNSLIEENKKLKQKKNSFGELEVKSSDSFDIITNNLFTFSKDYQTEIQNLQEMIIDKEKENKKLKEQLMNQNNND